MPSILESINLLEVVKETRSYIKCVCPVCHSDGLKISLSRNAYGAYKCYDNGCTPQAIREAMGLVSTKNYHLSPYKQSKPSSSYANKSLIQSIQTSKPIPNLENPTLLECPNYQGISSTTRTFAGGSKKKTTVYPYSSHQRIYRLDSYNPPDKKQVYLQTLEPDGSWVSLGAGPHTWQVYQYNLDILGSSGNTILAVEGEKTAEFVKERHKKACITFAALAYEYEYLYKILFVFFNKYKNISQIIYVPDHDKPGYMKAHKVQKVCWYLKKSCQIVTVKDFLQLDEEPEKGADLADYETHVFNR